MPKQYVPTGRPPGRPPKPAVEKLGLQDVVDFIRDTTCDIRSRPLRNFCPDCFPAGFPDGIRQMVCGHGVWVKR